MLFGQIGAAEAGRERAAHPVRAAAANQHKRSMPALIRSVPCMTHPPESGSKLCTSELSGVRVAFGPGALPRPGGGTRWAEFPGL